MIRITGETVGVGEGCAVRPGTAGLQGEAKVAFGFAYESRIDAARGRGPGFSLFALEPAPERPQPADQKKSEPNVDDPGPGAGFGPVER